MAEKNPAADRHHGGPGSSEQNTEEPEPAPETRPNPDEPPNKERSRVSGGGGERDIHHTHDPAHKS